MSIASCAECGARLEPDAKFCGECGTPIEGSPSTSHQQQTAEAHQSVSDQTGIAALTHILGLLTWVIGPLIVLLVTEDAFVKDNARNALNWQITFTIYFIVSLILLIVLIGIFTLFAVIILDLVFCIIAAVKAADGEAWRYPITIQFTKPQVY